MRLHNNIVYQMPGEVYLMAARRNYRRKEFMVRGRERAGANIGQCGRRSAVIDLGN